jgi:2-oxoglutarate dehydrogenase E2 component (dihydrolipoamide succinyltransferase)
MSVDIQVPDMGESITEVRLGQWLKANGDWVDRDELLVEIESDKVTQELPAPAAGVLSITQREGADVLIGAVIGGLDPNAPKPQASPSNAPASDASTGPDVPTTRIEMATESAASANVRATSMARKIAADQGVDLQSVHGSGPSGRIMKSDVLDTSATPIKSPPAELTVASTTPISADESNLAQAGIRREKMSPLRKRIAQRLVEAQHNAAMLTTFNEADMTAVMHLRNMHKDDFHDRYGVKLGFMSFFARAVVSALKAFPALNAYIDGDCFEYHDFVDLSIAIGTEKGLVVPVVRQAQNMGFADIEAAIAALAQRARSNKLTMADLTGGTFTISNGGVYGSMMSTPILNPPQSGILGLHRIMKRPVEDPDNPGNIVLRPMMYLAVSYDHRIVDGAGAVGFLVHIKNCIEQPDRLLLGL